MRIPTLAPERTVAVGSAVLALVGGVLPWIASASGSLSGIDTDGFLTAMAATSALGIVALWEWGRRQMAAVAVFGAVIVALTVSFLFSLEEITGATAGDVGPGVGVYVTLVAGVLLVGSGASGLVQRRRRPNAADDGDGTAPEDRLLDE